MSVIQLLRQRGVVPLEHHLSAVVAAWARTGDLVEAAFQVRKMRAGGVVPTEATSAAIVRELKRPAREAEAGDPEGSLFSLEPPARLRRFVDELRKVPPVDLTVYNALLEAAIDMRPFDMARLLEIYTMRPDMYIKPDARTFHLMLRGALLGQDAALATRLIADMRALSIPPTAVTYQHAIELALTEPADPANWSQRAAIANALQYLREMRASGMTPTLQTWDAVAVVLAEQRHALLHSVVEDMRAAGVPVSRALRNAMAPEDRALLLETDEPRTSRRLIAHDHF